jgi:hypothetical protein
MILRGGSIKQLLVSVLADATLIESIDFGYWRMSSPEDRIIDRGLREREREREEVDCTSGLHFRNKKEQKRKREKYAICLLVLLIELKANEGQTGGLIRRN